MTKRRTHGPMLWAGIAPLLPLAVLLAGCDGGNQGVGGVSADEARALNEAAEMLDNRAVPPGDDNILAPDEITPNAAAL